MDPMEEGPRALKAGPKRNWRTGIVEHSVTHGDRCPVINEPVHLAPRELWTLYHCGVWEHVGGGILPQLVCLIFFLPWHRRISKVKFKMVSRKQVIRPFCTHMCVS